MSDSRVSYLHHYVRCLSELTACHHHTFCEEHLETHQNLSILYRVGGAQVENILECVFSVLQQIFCVSFAGNQGKVQFQAAIFMDTWITQAIPNIKREVLVPRLSGKGN